MRTLIIVGALLAGTPWIVEGADSLVRENLPAPVSGWWASDEESSVPSEETVAMAVDRPVVDWAPDPAEAEGELVAPEEEDPFPLPYRAAVILVASGIVPLVFRRQISRSLERQSNAVNAGLVAGLAIPPTLASIFVTGGTGFVASSIVCGVGIGSVAASYLWLSALESSRSRS